MRLRTANTRRRRLYKPFHWAPVFHIGGVTYQFNIRPALALTTPKGDDHG